MASSSSSTSTTTTITPALQQLRAKLDKCNQAPLCHVKASTEDTISATKTAQRDRLWQLIISLVYLESQRWQAANSNTRDGRGHISVELSNVIRQEHDALTGLPLQQASHMDTDMTTRMLTRLAFAGGSLLLNSHVNTYGSISTHREVITMANQQGIPQDLIVKSELVLRRLRNPNSVQMIPTSAHTFSKVPGRELQLIQNAPPPPGAVLAAEGWMMATVPSPAEMIERICQLKDTIHVMDSESYIEEHEEGAEESDFQYDNDILM